MNHIILGYGYCGYYLARELLAHQQNVLTVSRQLKPDYSLPGVNHLLKDVVEPFDWGTEYSVVYYLIPPPSKGKRDDVLLEFLKNNSIKTNLFVYFSTSGVYGDHQGNWVNEESPCYIQSDRQERRLDAEQQCLSYCKQHNIPALILRVSGIFGPQRLPMEAARSQTAIIHPDEAPYTNHIYVEDLAKITHLLTQSRPLQTIYNIADGQPLPMGSLQQETAKLMQLPAAPHESYAQAFSKASPMKKEFMQSSKLLDINRLKSTLGERLILQKLSDAIKKSL